MSPDQLRFEEHLKLPEYRRGEIQGFWGREFITDQNSELGPKWPLSLFWISVPPKGKNKIERYYLRMDLSNYNVVAPASCFWDLGKNARLENRLWPKITGPFAQAFRIDWQNPYELYAPWDRGGINAHQNWVQDNMAVSWKAGQSTISRYLEIMHEILNSENYHGTKED